MISVAPPPTLQEARHAAPPLWQPTVDNLLDLATVASVELRVFGSLAWQWLTGLNYLTARSDLDLLFMSLPAANIPALLTKLAVVAACAPMRIDGEVVRADGNAAHWQELHAATGEVLVKSLNAVSVQGTATFLDKPERCA